MTAINLTRIASIALVAPDSDDIPRAVESYERKAAPAQMTNHRAGPARIDRKREWRKG